MPRARTSKTLMLTLCVILLAPILTPFASAANVLPPLPPLNPSPPDGAGPLGLNVTVSWSGGDVDSPVVTSKVYVSVDNGARTLACTTTGTSCVIRGLPYQASVRWQVEANDGDFTTTGAWWTFTTKRAPVAPHSPSPVDGQLDAARATTVSWNASDPDGFPLTYRVEVTPAGENATTHCQATTAKACNLGQLPPLTLHQWQVIASDGFQDTPGPVWSFTTMENVPPSTPQLGLPADGVTLDSTFVEFTWSSADGDGDPVLYTVLVTGAGDTVDAAVCGGENLSCVAELPLNSTFTWRVRADDGYALVDSATRTLSVRTNEEPSITSAAPADDARDVSWSPVLSWSASDPDGDALTYDVLFGADAGPTEVVCADLVATTCAVAGLAAGQRYHWQIVIDDGIRPIHSQVYSFVTLASEPPVLSSVTPAAGALGVGTSVTLGWSASDPEGDALTYDVYVSEDEPYAGVAVPQCQGLRVPACVVTGLAYDTTYYWWLMLSDGGNLVETEHETFRTRSSVAPNVPSGPFPANGEAGVVTRVLAWAASDPDGDALTYTVYGRSWDTPVYAPLVGCVAITAKSCTPTLPAGALIRWFVEADDGNLVTRGPEWTFTTAWDGVGAAATETFDLLPTTFAKSSEQVFSEVSWDAIGKAVKLVSDGRDAADERYGQTLVAPLSRLTSWSVDVDVDFARLGQRQQSTLLYLAAPGAAIGSATDNQISIVYRSPLSTSPGLSIPNAYGTTSQVAWTPDATHVYRIHVEFEAATQALTVRLTDLTNGQRIFEDRDRIQAGAAFGPFTALGFGSKGQGKSVTSSDEVTEVLLDNLKITTGATLAGAIPIYMDPLPGARQVQSGALTTTWSTAGYASAVFDAKLFDASGALVASCENVASTCAVSGLDPGAAYSWSVQPDGGSAPAWPFAVSKPNEAPAFVSTTTTPTLGRFVFEWSATDGDGDALLYTVSFGRAGQPLDAICRTYKTTCDVGVFAPGEAFEWVVTAFDGTDLVPSQTTSTNGPLPTMRCHAGSSSVDCPMGVATAVNGWVFEPVFLGASTTSFSGNVLISSTTGSSNPIGVGYNGWNVGYHTSSTGIFLTTVTFSSVGCSLNSDLTVTPQSGSVRGMRVTKGSQLTNGMSVWADGWFSSTTGAKTIDADASTCNSDYWLRLRMSQMTKAEGAANGMSWSVQDVPDDVYASMTVTGSTVKTYKGRIDLSSSSTSFDGWINMGGHGTLYVNDFPSSVTGTLVMSGSTFREFCVSASSGPSGAGTDVLFDRSWTTPSVKVDVQNLMSVSVCADAYNRDAQFSTSYAFSGGRYVGVTSVKVYDSWGWFEMAGSNLRTIVASAWDGDASFTTAHFGYDGNINIDVRIYGLGHLQVTDLPRDLDLEISKANGDLRKVWFSGKSGTSATRIWFNGEIAGVTAKFELKRVGRLTFLYDSALNNIISGNIYYVDYLGTATGDFNTGKLKGIINAWGVQNWGVSVKGSEITAGAHLRRYESGGGSVSVTFHYKISSWAGIDRTAQIYRRSDNRYEFVFPFALDDDEPEGGPCRWRYYVAVTTTLCSRFYQSP